MILCATPILGTLNSMIKAKPSSCLSACDLLHLAFKQLFPSVGLALVPVSDLSILVYLFGFLFAPIDRIRIHSRIRWIQ